MEKVKQPLKLCEVTMYELMVKESEDKMFGEFIVDIGIKIISQEIICLNQHKTRTSLWNFVW